MYLDKNNMGYLMNKATRLMKWDLTNKLQEFGLTSAQWSVLKDLSCHEGSDKVLATPAAIAERLNVDRPTMSGIINRLTQKGWVTADVNPEDRRSQIIKLTDKAVGAMERIEELSRETVDVALNGFSKEEISALKGSINRIINNFTDK